MKIYKYGCESCEEIYTSLVEQTAIDAADECCAPLDVYFYTDELVEVDCD